MLYGDESLSSRPMKRVAEPLSLLGADVQTTDGHAPVYVNPKRLQGADVTISVSSAQVKSALLLAGISAEGKTMVTEPTKSRDHTERMLAAMGAKIEVNGNSVTVEKSVLRTVCRNPSAIFRRLLADALSRRTVCVPLGLRRCRK